MCTRKEIIKIRAEVNELETKKKTTTPKTPTKNKAIEKISETKNWFFEEINRIVKPFARFIKKNKIKCKNKRKSPN